MGTMGKYCKAYLLGQLREFSGWSEVAEQSRKETCEVNDEEVEVSRTLDDDSIVYIQENYVVTDDIFKDEYILFDNVTPEWKSFCDGQLGFSIPDDVLEASAASEEMLAGDGNSVPSRDVQQES